MQLVERLLSGDVRAVARGISMVEQNAASAVNLLRETFPQTGNATVIGLTGSPGSGKSSLVDRLIAAYRADDRKVGVVGVCMGGTFTLLAACASARFSAAAPFYGITFPQAAAEASARKAGSRDLFRKACPAFS